MPINILLLDLPFNSALCYITGILYGKSKTKYYRKKVTSVTKIGFELVQLRVQDAHTRVTYIRKRLDN